MSGGRQSRGQPVDTLKLRVVEVLRDVGASGITKKDLVARIGRTSLPSVQRALDVLRDEHDAPIEVFGSERRWRLTRSFSLPLTAPEPADLVALLVAEAILEPLADADLLARVRRLVEEVDEKVRQNHEGRSLPSRSSLSSTLTLGTRVDPEITKLLLNACRRDVLEIRYTSPWKNPPDPQRYTVEPWSLRVHDGAIYVRAWVWQSQAARTFRVAQIDEAVRVDAKRVGPSPSGLEIWGDEHPAFGIDHDRPDVATITMQGAVARWMARVVWHPDQVDRWLHPDRLLERRLPYRSCRELARRLASVHDGLVSVSPAALANEVAVVTGAVPTLPGVISRVSPDTPPAASTPGEVSTPRSRAADGDRRP